MKSVKIANVAVASFEDLSAVSNADLLGFYNATTGKSTTKFASREKGLKQVWSLVEPMLTSGTEAAQNDRPLFHPAHPLALIQPGLSQKTSDEAAAATAPSPKKEVQKKEKAAPGERKSRGFRFKFQKREEIKDVKAGSKREQLLNLLKQPGGATFEECMAATGWNRKDCYEAIRLLHYYVGYGLDMNEQTGKIWVVS